MTDTSPPRGGRHRGDLVRPEPGRASDPRGSGRDQPRRVATWARALAAVVLLDPSALPGPRSTGSQAATAGRRAGSYAVSMCSATNRFRAGDPSADSSLRTGRAAAGRDVPALLAVVDAAAALIEAGDEDSALLLLALAEPAPERPAGARDALRLLTGTRSRGAACPPGGRSPLRTPRRRGPRGGWGGWA